MARRNSLAFCIAVMLFVVTSSQAYADGLSAHAQITCIPERGYFKLESVNLPNPSDKVRTTPPDFLSAHSLEKAPYRCLLGAHEIVVEGQFHTGMRGACAYSKGQVARVLVDGVPLGLDQRSRTLTKFEGWFELSSCFEQRTRVTVEASTASRGQWFRADFCKVKWSDEKNADGVTWQQELECRHFDTPPMD